jgi:hypothetical protein
LRANESRGARTARLPGDGEAIAWILLQVVATRALEPMAVTSGFTSFVEGQLEELGDVPVRSMSGGLGFYKEGTHPPLRTSGT